jgi:hypothetical protein
MRDMNGRDTRREENQKRFRLGNERLLDVVGKRVPEDAPVPFFCECADDECFDTVEVQPRLWEAVAAQPNHYLMIGAHQRSEGEKIVRSLGAYDVVQKPN